MPARPPVCSAYEILIFLSSTAWGLLTMLCLWPPIWTMVPRQVHCSWLCARAVLCTLCCAAWPAAAEPCKGLSHPIRPRCPLQHSPAPPAIFHCRVETEHGWKIVWDPFEVPPPPRAGGLGGQNPSAGPTLAPGGESMLSNALSGIFQGLKRPFTTTAGTAKRLSMDKRGQQQELHRQSVGRAAPQPPKSTVPLAGMSVNVGGAASSNALSPFTVQSQASCLMSVSA